MVGLRQVYVEPHPAAVSVLLSNKPTVKLTTVKSCLKRQRDFFPTVS